jgi:hypothetical protein
MRGSANCSEHSTATVVPNPARPSRGREKEMSNAKTKIVLAFTAGVCIGGGAGYLIAERTIRKQAAEDLEAVQVMFRRVRDESSTEPNGVDEAPESEAKTNIAEEDRYQTPAESITADEEIIRLGYAQREALLGAKLDPNYVSPYTNPNDGVEELEYEDTPLDDHPTPEKEVVNVRTISHNPMYEPDPDDVTSWDRSPDFPYVITEAEYRIDRPEFEKDSLTYYAGDDTLAEENGNYIPDKNGTAGNHNLLECFGMGSGDDRLLYIRNERVMADFEINLNDGKYTKEVLDVEEEDDTPQRRVIKKMRRGE